MLQVQLGGAAVSTLLTLLALLGAFLISKRRSSVTRFSSPCTHSPPLAPLIPLVDPSSDTSDRANVRDTFLHRRALYGSVFRALEPHGAIISYIGDALTIKDVIESDAFDIAHLHTAAAPMWNLSPDAGDWFARQGGQATLRHSSHLFSGARLASLQARFVACLSKQLDAVQVGGREDLFGLASESFFQATVEALFTSTFPRGRYAEFLRWDAELNRFCLGCPSPEAVEARDRFYRLASMQIDEHLDECSLQVRDQLHDVEQNHGQTHADAVAVVLRTAWLGSTQSPLAGAWLVCILARQPDKIQRIRNELSQLKSSIGIDSTEQIASNPELLKGENLPLLENLVQELLRVYSAQNVPRMCLKDTTVRAVDGAGRVTRWQVRQGDTLQLLFWNVHNAQHHSQWWPEQEGKGEKFRGTLETFDETRFEDEARKPSAAKWGDETVRTWTPFGYGARVCPGRYWAVAEIKAFVLLFLDRFEVGQVGEMPRPDPTRWVGVLHATDAVSAFLTART